MTSETQVLYRGKHADSRPTAEQIALLQKMGVRKEVIESLNRGQAFLLIRQIWQKYYEEKAKRQLHDGWVRW
jgi:hypothetical protein